MNTSEHPSKVVHVRLTKTTHTRLAEWARRERRSITSAVELLVEVALDADEQK